MTEQNELQKIIFDSNRSNTQIDLQSDRRLKGSQLAWAGFAAASILAAGYRKLRTITTVEELDALPVGSVVILRDAKGDPHPAQKGDHGWRLPFVDSFWTAEKLLSGSESAEVIS